MFPVSTYHRKENELSLIQNQALQLKGFLGTSNKKKGRGGK